MDKSLSSDYYPVVITSYHRPKTFIKCVTSVLQATHQPIYIIDNSEGGIDRELDWAKSESSQITIIRNKKNIGKPASIQQYYKEINPGQWFITMDPDVIVPKDGIDRLISRADANLKAGHPIGIVTPAIYQNFTWEEQLKSKKLDMHIWEKMYLLQPNYYINSMLAGCLMLVNRSLFDFVGGFSSNRLYNDDDGWLCNQSIINGSINCIDSSIICYHDTSEETQEYKNWKKNNSIKQVDSKGLWDQ